ncbi:hypothetical protein SAMN05444389_101453 [Paracoccus solventivorans]|uniref:BppU N-terminal domain-containing protein n=1 Tax=Paracoccus solventivorans TaxID=53463 RepID=A0A1M7DMW3_9RHOB|nr:hypothetical protein [Paracoccus solventivorans]SHL80854.1 hypothetical protein SAMN05444389_101453 [Paracoccus solventivorans]
MATFYIKRGDTAPALRYALLPETVDLSGASVAFVMDGLGRQPAHVIEARPAVVQYDWQPGDTDRSGLHRAEFEVTYSDGAIETWPNAGYLLVQISEDLG